MQAGSFQVLMKIYLSSGIRSCYMVLTLQMRAFISNLCRISPEKLDLLSCEEMLDAIFNRTLRA